MAADILLLVGVVLTIILFILDIKTDGEMKKYVTRAPAYLLLAAAVAHYIST